MKYTQEEINRLVPEGFIRLTPNGMVRDSSLAVAKALLTTRRQLEIAREGLETIALDEGPHTWASVKAREALSAINKEGE